MRKLITNVIIFGTTAAWVSLLQVFLWAPKIQLPLYSAPDPGRSAQVLSIFKELCYALD